MNLNDLLGPPRPAVVPCRRCNRFVSGKLAHDVSGWEDLYPEWDAICPPGKGCRKNEPAEAPLLGSDYDMMTL